MIGDETKLISGKVRIGWSGKLGMGSEFIFEENCVLEICKYTSKISLIISFYIAYGGMYRLYDYKFVSVLSLLRLIVLLKCFSTMKMMCIVL
jgi:hypothetical protein